MKIKETQPQKTTSVCLSEAEKEIIKSVDLLQEIEPLLREYFIGNFEMENNAMILSFINGQRFRLIAEEIR